MKLKPLTVLADDLTGACELAAIGHNWGLETAVQTCLETQPEAADLVVYDTEPRLDPPAVAGEKLRELALRIRDRQPQRLLYKKTDSVVRGPIAAELEALLEVLPFQRAFFIPSNPGMGRVVRDGFYRINGVPLHETGFSGDLHHPARSSLVVELLGPVGDRKVHPVPAGQDPPESGVIIGDAGSEADLDQWAARLDGQTLPAGAASFFRAILRRQRGEAPGPTSPPMVQGRTLLISGTTDPGQQAVLEGMSRSGFPSVRRSLAQLDDTGSHGWAGQIRTLLQRESRCLAHVDSSMAPDPARANLVREALADMAANVLRDGSIGHLVVEGGATAAAICQAMGWDRFTVAHAWAQGIVSLRPVRNPAPLFTLKPGSYAWPDSFKSILTGDTAGQS